MEDKYFKEIAFVIDDIDEINEHIYEQLAKNIGKLIDIDFAKTPVVDLFTGYQRGLILQQRIDKAIKYIHNNQPVFELSSKAQIQEWFEKEYYVELLKILKGDSNE